MLSRVRAEAKGKLAGLVEKMDEKMAKVDEKMDAMMASRAAAAVTAAGCRDRRQDLVGCQLRRPHKG